MKARLPEQTIYIIDDDAAVLDSLSVWLRSTGHTTRTWSNPQHFLDDYRHDWSGCVILDLQMPALSGLALQEELVAVGSTLPIIFMTGHGDIPMTVRAMKAGAIEFLTKPFRDQEMLDAVHNALAEWRERRSASDTARAVKTSFASLSAREQSVLERVSCGLMNKQIAGELGVSEITVKVHRGNVMRKMGARTLPDLVRMAEILGLHPTKQ